MSLCGLTFTSFANLADMLNLAMFNEFFFSFRGSICILLCIPPMLEAVIEHLRGGSCGLE